MCYSIRQLRVIFFLISPFHFTTQLTIEKDHFMNNIFYILKWDAQKNLRLLRKKVDKGESWSFIRMCF